LAAQVARSQVESSEPQSVDPLALALALLLAVPQAQVQPQQPTQEKLAMWQAPALVELPAQSLVAL